MNKSGDPSTVAYQQLTLFEVEAVAAAATPNIPTHDSYWDAITHSSSDRAAAVPERDKVDHQLTSRSSSSAPDLPLAQEHFVPEQQTDAIVLEQDTREVLPIVEYLEKIGGVGVARLWHRPPAVLERDTKNPVPEHKTPGLGTTTDVPEHIQLEFLQWVEQYRPSTRKANSYYRYCYKQSRKIHHIHICGGNTRSPLAQRRKLEIESAIADGDSPVEIKHLIQSWSGK